MKDYFFFTVGGGTKFGLGLLPVVFVVFVPCDGPELRPVVGEAVLFLVEGCNVKFPLGLLFGIIFPSLFF